MDSTPTQNVDAHIQATLQHLRNDGWNIKELDYAGLGEILPSIINEAQQLFPTVTADKVEELIISTEIDLDAGSAPANPPGRQITVPAANPPSRVKQGKLDSWLVKANVPPMLAYSDNEDGSTLQEPAALFFPGPLAGSSEPAAPDAYPGPTPSDGFRLPQSSQPHYGRRLFDNTLRIATKYWLDKKDTKPLEWVTAQGHQRLFDLLKQCTRPSIWEHFVDGNKAFDRDFLLSLPDEDIDKMPGWYLIVLYDEVELSWWRVYVGQSVDIRSRWHQHERASTNENFQAFLYEVWRGGEPVPDDKVLPHKAKFIFLGSDQGQYQDDNDIGCQTFRNLGETFFALVFQSLQPKTLSLWIPEDIHINQVFRGTNIAVPVQGGYSQCTLASIWSNPDPVAIQYAMKRVMSALRGANEVQSAENYKAFTHGRRKAKIATNFRSGIFRDGDPSKGDPAIVRVKCKTCGTERDDCAPSFVNLTGEYLVRAQMCKSCELSSDDIRRKRKTSAQIHLPVNPTLACVDNEALMARINKDPALRQKYEGKGNPDTPEPRTSTPGGRAPKRNNFELGIFRHADPAKGEPKKVSVKCKACGWVRDDDNPSFLVVTGQYLARSLGCKGCLLPANKGRKTPLKTFIPVSPTLAYREKKNFEREVLKNPQLIPDAQVLSAPVGNPEPSDEDDEPPHKRRNLQRKA